MGALDNGNVEKLAQLERRVNSLEQQVGTIGELKVEVSVARERLTSISQTLSRIERHGAEDRREIKDELDAVKSSIRAEADKSEAERASRSIASARERIGYIAAGGVILASVISALALLLDKA